MMEMFWRSMQSFVGYHRWIYLVSGIVFYLTLLLLAIALGSLQYIRQPQSTDFNWQASDYILDVQAQPFSQEVLQQMEALTRSPITVFVSYWGEGDRLVAYSPHRPLDDQVQFNPDHLGRLPESLPYEVLASNPYESIQQEIWLHSFEGSASQASELIESAMSQTDPRAFVRTAYSGDEMQTMNQQSLAQLKNFQAWISGLVFIFSYSNFLIVIHRVFRSIRHRLALYHKLGLSRLIGIMEYNISLLVCYLLAFGGFLASRHFFERYWDIFRYVYVDRAVLVGAFGLCLLGILLSNLQALPGSLGQSRERGSSNDLHIA